MCLAVLVSACGGARYEHLVQRELVEPVRELEAWNGAEGHLLIEFHDYEGAHAGSEAARAEMAQSLTTIASE